MTRDLLAEYARLLTADTAACVLLFAHDAEYKTRLGSHDLALRGRAEIQGFLSHVPRQLSFHAGPCVKDAAGYRGEVHIRGEGFPPRTHTVRYTVDAGLITNFEVVSHAPPTFA